MDSDSSQSNNNHGEKRRRNVVNYQELENLDGIDMDDDSSFAPSEPIGGRSSGIMEGGAPNGASQSVDVMLQPDPQKSEIRTGREFQAEIPALIEDKRSLQKIKERETCLWAPSSAISDADLMDYIHIAREKWGFNPEQSLGLLLWHKHNRDKAISDFNKFLPYPNPWSLEDRILFEEAFQQHGKSFARIRNMIPDKTIPELIQYYYMWKKKKHQRGYIQTKRLRGSDDDSPAEDTDDEDALMAAQNPRKLSCANCGQPAVQPQESPKGILCCSCYQYYRSTGYMRGSRWGSGRKALLDAERTAKGTRKPKSVAIDLADLKFLANEPDKGAKHLESLDMHIEKLKEQVQNNRGIIAHLKASSLLNPAYYEPEEIDDQEPPRQSHRWSSDDAQLAVLAVRTHGRNYKAIAELLGTKTAAHVQSWFANNREKLSLDKLVEDFEAERKKRAASATEELIDLDDDDIEMEEEDAANVPRPQSPRKAAEAEDTKMDTSKS